jgi:hypothetical protein
LRLRGGVKSGHFGLTFPNSDSEGRQGMFARETYAAGSTVYFVEGKSRGEAARVFGLSLDTIAKMCCYSAHLGYVRSKDPERPKHGP